MKVALIKGQEAATHWLRCCIGMFVDRTFYSKNVRSLLVMTLCWQTDSCAQKPTRMAVRLAEMAIIFLWLVLPT